jgi:predicted ATPase
VLVNRTRELQFVKDKLAQVPVKPHGFLVLNRGEAGIGKTALAEQIIKNAKSDFLVLRGRGYEEQNSPLFCFTELMGSFLESHKFLVLKETLAVSVLNLAEWFPGIGDYVRLIRRSVRDFQRLASVDKYSVTNTYQVFNSYWAVLAKLSESKPVLLFIDDLQWLDQTSLELFGFLSRKAHTKPIAILACYRSAYVTNEKEAVAKDFLDRLLKEEAAKSFIIDLDKVHFEDYDQLVMVFIGKNTLSADDIKLLYEHTEGNPFFLRSLLSLLKQNGDLQVRNGICSPAMKLTAARIPASIADVVKTRLDRLYRDMPSAKEILSYAAVLGYRFDTIRLRDILRKDLASLLVDLGQIEDAYALIRSLEQKAKYEFDHRTTQEVIYDNLGRIVLEFHRQIAEFLESRADEYRDPYSVAYHYEKADLIEKALPYVRECATEASRAYAFSEACKYHEKFLSLALGRSVSTDVITQVRMDLAHSLLDSNQLQRCIAHVHRLLEEDAGISPATKAEALYVLGRAYRMQGLGEAGEKCIRALQDSYCIAKKLREHRMAGEVLSMLATAYDHFAVYNKVLIAFKESQKAYNLAKDAVGLAKLQRKSGIIYDSRRAIRFMQDALRTFRERGMRIEAARCLNNIGMENFYIGLLNEAEKSLREAHSIYRSLDFYEVDITTNNIGLLKLVQGDYDTALIQFEDSREQASEPFNEIFATMNMATALRMKGETQSAKQILGDIRQQVMAYREPVLQDYYGLNYGSILLDLGEYLEAVRNLTLFPVNTYKGDRALAEAKRCAALAKAYQGIGDSTKAKRYERRASTLFRTVRPQKWFYQLPYYPCDIHVLD